MDMSSMGSMAGGMGGGGGGGANSAQTSVNAAASIQDEIAAYLEPILVRNQLRDALRNARKETREGYDQAMGYQQPYYDTGTANLKTISDLYRSGQLDTAIPQWNDQQFTNTWKQDPGYNFRIQEGQQAIEGAAASRGGLLSSGTLKALQRYGSELASQEYDKVYQRAYGRMLDAYRMQNQQNENRFNYGNLLAGYGERAGSRLSDLRLGKGEALSDIAIQRGNVEAGMLHGIGNAAHLQAQDARSFVGNGRPGYETMYGGNAGGGSFGQGGDIGLGQGIRKSNGMSVQNIDNQDWGQYTDRG